MQFYIRDLRMKLMIINEFREVWRKEDHTFVGA